MFHYKSYHELSSQGNNLYFARVSVHGQLNGFGIFAYTFVDGKLINFAWVSGDINPADWCTKPHSPKYLLYGGFWESGPEFRSQEETSWPIKQTYRTDRLEGEFQIKSHHVI